MRIVWLALLSLLVLSLASASAEQILLKQEHGIYTVSVRINQAVSIQFVLDSGASEVSIPTDVFMTLMRIHSVRDNDFIGDGIFITADGTKHKSQRFILREVQAGTRVIKDVIANVVSIEGDPLLGQSFLSRLPSWSIDNNSHVLNLVAGEAVEATPETLPASNSPVSSPPATLPQSGNVSTLRHATRERPAVR
jgi:clan AA aspartic protease (TIGR02281 family)